MFLVLRNGWLGLLILIATSSALASSSVTSSTSVVQEPTDQAKIYSGFFQLAGSTSLYDFHDGTRQDGMDYLLRVNLIMNKDYSFRITTGYSQNLDNNANLDGGGYTVSGFTDSSIALVRSPIPMGSYLLFAPSIAVGIPTSQQSREGASLEAALKAGFTALINPAKLWTGVDLAFIVNGSRNINQYDTALDGSINTEYVLIEGISADYSYGNFSISAEFSNRNNWGYDGSTQQYFEHTEELDYQLNPTFLFGLGHTNSGSIFKPNGVDSNIELINEDTSMVYASLAVIF